MATSQSTSEVKKLRKGWRFFFIDGITFSEINLSLCVIFYALGLFIAPHAFVELQGFSAIQAAGVNQLLFASMSMVFAFCTLLASYSGRRWFRLVMMLMHVFGWITLGGSLLASYTGSPGGMLMMAVALVAARAAFMIFFYEFNASDFTSNRHFARRNQDQASLDTMGQ